MARQEGRRRLWNQGRRAFIFSSCEAGARRRDVDRYSLPSGAPQRISTLSFGL
jgi:hypothetical protein